MLRCRDAHRWWGWLRPPEPAPLLTLPMADTAQPGDSSKEHRNEPEERNNETSEKKKRENGTCSHQATSDKAGSTFFGYRSYMRKIRAI